MLHLILVSFLMPGQNNFLIAGSLVSSKTSDIGCCHDPKHYIGPCEYSFTGGLFFSYSENFNKSPTANEPRVHIKLRKGIPLRKNKKYSRICTPKFFINSTLDFPDIASILQFWTGERMEILKPQRTCAVP